MGEAMVAALNITAHLQNFSEKLTEAGMPEESAIDYENAYSYWGTQPGTSGPVYLGAIMCFLFIFSLVYLKSWHKWWLIATAVIGILLAWVRISLPFNYFLFDYLPLYNKFRAPSMGLVLTHLLFRYWQHWVLINFSATSRQGI
jgi:hypothetical protein